MKQNKHWSSLVLKEEKGTRFWFETPGGITIAFKCKEDFIETYKKHKRTILEKWKEKRSDDLNELCTDGKRLAEIINIIGEDNFINSIMKYSIESEEEINCVCACCVRNVVRKYKSIKLYDDFTYWKADRLLREVFKLYMSVFVYTNTEIVEEYFDKALEIESHEKSNKGIDAMLDCYGLYMSDDITLVDSVCKIFLPEEAEKYYTLTREIENMFITIDSPEEDKLAYDKMDEEIWRISIKLAIRMLHDILQSVNQ